jgi:opine dehydrogenase
MPLLSDSDRTGYCVLKKIKNVVDIAAVPASSVVQSVENLKEILPWLSPVENVVATSINNSNPILHVPITLFNLTRIENGEHFHFYNEAASKHVIRFIEHADLERIAIAESLGVKARSCLEILNSFWPQQWQNLYDAIKNNSEYMLGHGPVTLDYRYITEDIPYGIVPLVKLAKKKRVKIPYLGKMLDIFCLVLNIDFYREGPTVESCDFSVLF